MRLANVPDNWTECPYGAPENALTCSQNGKTVYSTCSDKCGPEYRNIECKKYEEEEKCVNDASMKICVPTCESRLAADGYKVNEDVSGAVITKNTTFSTTNGKNFRSVEGFSHQISGRMLKEQKAETDPDISGCRQCRR